MTNKKYDVYIFGGGTCGLFAASFLSLQNPNIKIALFEKEKSLGRKFLVAGKGGFNLTHNPKKENFHQAYSPSSIFKEWLNKFNANDSINWLNEIKISTFIGTSNRLFPSKDIKPIDVLNAIKLSFRKTTDIYTNHELINIFDDYFEIKNKLNNQIMSLPKEKSIIGFGGKSWAKTGSDGNWINFFIKKNIKITPFIPSNTGVVCQWPKEIEEIEGKPLKNISIRCNNKSIKGECMITKYGLEGNTIYTLNKEIRKNINKHKLSEIFIDLKPQFSEKQIIEKIKLNTNTTKSLKTNLKLSKEQITFIKTYTNKETFTSPEKLSFFLKNIPLKVFGFRNFDEAISSSGGIELDEINEYFELKKIKNIYVVGEMLDWDATTGGYLIQGCYTTTYIACQDILNKLK